MSASLVGSEMCIRDRDTPPQAFCGWGEKQPKAHVGQAPLRQRMALGSRRFRRIGDGDPTHVAMNRCSRGCTKWP
eukprot:2203192-Alexandrium_andersonii.AAC.1